ncbi:MAG: DUF2726 domain-containing protein [Pseudomonadota bacterium]
MNILALVVLAVVVLIFIALRIKAGTGNSGDVWPFYAKKPLTHPEQVLYFRLKDALPDHMILAQVQLSRFLGVRKDANSRAWKNRINRMSVDFLVCEKDAGIVAAVELDDRSHDRPDRREADGKKEKALGSAKVRLIRWNAKDIPNIARIREVILHHEVLSPSTLTTTVIARDAELP